MPWQCPGCKTWYAPAVTKCTCQQVQTNTTTWPWRAPWTQPQGGGTSCPPPRWPQGTQVYC